MSEKMKKTPSLGVALIPMLSTVVILFVGVFVFGADPHIPIMVSSVIAVIVALYLGYTWKEIEEGIVQGISLSLQALIILIILGTLISTWLAAGVVPTMIYYGLDLSSPSFFLPLAVIICSVVSVCSGNAWTAAGTIGIAVMGVGIVLGLDPAMVAGAIISGCYFGDKMSPLSETTNMAPGITGVALFEHIRHMVYTTLPAWIISVIMFFFLGLNISINTASMSDIVTLQQELNSFFIISPWLLLVPFSVLGMIYFKMPAIPGLLIGTFLGSIIAIVVQGETITDVSIMMISGFAIESDIEVVNNLLNNGGIEAMMYTVSLVMLAMSLGGVLEKTGILEAIVLALLKFAKSTGSLIATTVATCITANIVGCEQYLSILLPGRMYLTAYRKRGLHPKNLSRTLEDAGTMTSPLVPWSTCGVFMATTLGVATIDYAPYTFLCIVSPIIAVIYGFIGFKIDYLPKEDLEMPIAIAVETKKEQPITP